MNCIQGVYRYRLNKSHETEHNFADSIQQPRSCGRTTENSIHFQVRLSKVLIAKLVNFAVLMVELRCDFTPEIEFLYTLISKTMPLNAIYQDLWYSQVCIFRPHPRLGFDNNGLELITDVI